MVQVSAMKTQTFFFTKFLVGGGDLLSGTIFGPHRGWSQMGGLASGTEADEGDLKILSAEAKNAPLQQNYSKFWCFKHKIALSGAVLS